LLRYKLQGELVETLTNIIGLRGIKVLRKKNRCGMLADSRLSYPTSNKRMSLRRQSEFAPAQLLIGSPPRRLRIPNPLPMSPGQKNRISPFCVVLLSNRKGFSGESASKLVEFVEPITLSAK
jgi:hypothetical protein